MIDDDLAAARYEIASGCRVMAHRGLAEDILGHISLRLDDDHVLMRCRGPEEAGLAATVADDIRLVELATGRLADDPTGTYAAPSELPIHTTVLRARPEVRCVVHAHPPNVVVASVAKLPFVPLIGAYNIPATRLAAEGIPVHPRSVLLRSDALASEMVASLADRPVVVLAGHGVVTVGENVAQAVLRALHLETLARLTVAVCSTGAVPLPIPDDDLAELPDLGAGFNEATLWRHHLAELAATGRALDDPRKVRP